VFRTLAAVSLDLLYCATAFAQCGRTPVHPAKPFTLKQVWAVDATYIDQKHGVTFRYPSIWKAETQFGYHPPALTEKDGTKPIAGFGYEEGGFPRDHIVGPYSSTNLEGFGIVYSAFSAANASACETKASYLSEAHTHRAVTLGDRSFLEYDTGEAGMSQSNSGRLYSTYARSTCYLFETDMATSSGALDEFRSLSPEQSNFINENLLKIIKSVRIAPREQR
jgi:hypothetical protein